MRKLIIALLFAPIIAFAQFGDGAITGFVNGQPITITTEARYAGAISSITFRGKEYIDSTGDHGRLMQSSFFGPAGVCWNPTEAGARDDWMIPDYTTSVLLSHSSANGVLATQVNPAFWYHVGQSDVNCPGGATNGKNVSNHVFSKQVTIGRYGIANLIEYNVQMATPNTGNGLGTYEALTGYMPQEFSIFRTVNLTTGVLTAVSDGPGEQSAPLVFSTPDEQHAMGVYCQGLPQSTYPNAGYGRFRFGNVSPPVVKWNAVYRFDPPPKGPAAFRCYIAVGTTQEVVSALMTSTAYAKP